MFFTPVISSTFFHYVPYMWIWRTEIPLLQFYAALIATSTTLSVLYHFYERKSDLLFRLNSLGTVLWILADLGIASYLLNPLLLLFIIISNSVVWALHHLILIEVRLRHIDYESVFSRWHLLSAAKSTIVTLLFYREVVEQEKLKSCIGPNEGLLLLSSSI